MSWLLATVDFNNLLHEASLVHEVRGIPINSAIFRHRILHSTILGANYYFFVLFQN